MEGLKGILYYFKKFRLLVTAGTICLLLTDLGQLVIPLMVRDFVDKLAVKNITSEKILVFGIEIALVAIFIAAFRFLWRYFLLSASRKTEQDIRERLMNHLVRLSPKFFTKNKTGEMMALATNDAESVRMAIGMGVVTAFDAFFYTLFAIAAMIMISPSLTFFTSLPLPVLAILMGFSIKVIDERFDLVQESFSSLTEKVREGISGVRIIKAFSAIEGEVKDFGRFTEDYRKKNMSLTLLWGPFFPAITLLSGCSIAILIWAGGKEVITGRITIGDFAAFSSFLMMLAWPMMAAGWTANIIQRGIVSMKRILSVLGEKPDISEKTEDLTPLISGAISFKDLSFAYERDRQILKGINIEVSAGGSLGVVGDVGSGKSTIANLLCRLYEPPVRSIFIDGYDITAIKPTYLRSVIGLVPQEPFLFSDTISENLRMGKVDAAFEEMVAVCKMVSIHDEIISFPDGYETLLGERGITLSGGQKQRLCLARALLLSPKILVLDDTLSAVDAKTEAIILSNLPLFMRNRTAIVISHKLSAVKSLDEIAVMKSGKIVEMGSHDELLKVKGYYRHLYDLQERS